MFSEVGSLWELRYKINYSMNSPNCRKFYEAVFILDYDQRVKDILKNSLGWMRGIRRKLNQVVLKLEDNLMWNERTAKQVYKSNKLLVQAVANQQLQIDSQAQQIEELKNIILDQQIFFSQLVKSVNFTTHTVHQPSDSKQSEEKPKRQRRKTKFDTALEFFFEHPDIAKDLDGYSSRDLTAQINASHATINDARNHFLEQRQLAM